MKAATHNKACMPDKSVRGASAHRRAAAHSLKRHLVGASLPAYAADSARPTVTILDGPVGTAAACEAGTVLTIPRVLLIDRDLDTATALSSLLVPEARVVHAASCAEARRLLESDLFSLIIVDPAMPDGNAGHLLASVANTPMLVYSATEIVRNEKLVYLPKPFTTPRQLWSTISAMLGMAGCLTAGD